MRREAGIAFDGATTADIVSRTAHVLLPGAVLVRPPLDFRELLSSHRLSPRRFPDFSWAWLARFALRMSISLVLTYQLFFLRSRLGLDEAAPRSGCCSGCSRRPRRSRSART